MQKWTGRNLRTSRQEVAPAVPKPSMLAAQQTRSSWAKSVSGWHEIPQVFRNSFEMLCGGASEWPYTVLLPTYEGFMRRENERLIFSLDDKIHLLERAGNKIACISYPVQDISSVEQGMILLRAWVRISGIACGGVPSSSTFPFNAVTDYVLAPLIVKMRPAIGGLRDTYRAELAKFDYLARLNWKFMSYGRRSILPGEKVIDTLLEPEMRTQVLAVLGRSFSRLVFTSHLCILTDSELILIREEEQAQLSRDARYGATWIYIALSKITGVTLEARDRDLLALSIHLPGSDPIVSLFSVSNERKVSELLDRLEHL